MSVTIFDTYQVGVDVYAAFHDAADASRLAGDLLERNDPRVAHTWGPAGAIPVRQPTSPAGTQEPDGWLFFGWASC